MAGEKSKILIIGGTGHIGKFIVEASAKSDHPTFLLVRESTASNPDKAKLIEGFKASGVTLLYGDLSAHECLVKAIKEVDVVISAVGLGQLADQTKIIDAIKEAGNIKRFFPSEFGHDVDHVHAVDPTKTLLETKAKIRRAIEAAGIPYTYVASNFFAGYFDVLVGIPYKSDLPTDEVTIFGDGNPKSIFVNEEDIGMYTIKAVDDPRTLNKVLHLRPPSNILSHNELVSLWEKNTGKTIKRVYVPEEEVLKQIQGLWDVPLLLSRSHDDPCNDQLIELLNNNPFLTYTAEAPIPVNIVLSIKHSVFVKGDHANFEIEPSFGVEASELYPDVKYTTVDEYLSHSLKNY